MRVAIVDDNPIEQLNLRTLLQQVTDIKIVGEANNIASAKALIMAEKPDAVFLDIELGRETGFQLLDELPLRPLVVFTTLHRDYAVQAFDVKAVDYLIKPVTEDRLLRALDRVAAVLARHDGPHTLDLSDLLVFKKGNERHLVAVDSVALILGDRDYTQVVTADGREYLDDRRMRDWQTILPAKHFPVLDRSTIVNLAEISSYQPTSEGGRLLWRNSAKPLQIGRSAFKRLEECSHRSPTE